MYISDWVRDKPDGLSDGLMLKQTPMSDSEGISKCVRISVKNLMGNSEQAIQNQQEKSCGLICQLKVK